MTRKNLAAFLGAAALISLILDSGHALQWASEGVELCIRTVVPALFPFFVFSAYLTGNLGTVPILSPVARWFQADENAVPVLICGFLGGYPVGAHSAAEQWKQGTLSQAQAKRMLAFCSQAGPSFLFGIVSGCFSNLRAAWLLWGIQLTSAWMVSVFVPGEIHPGKRAAVSENITLVQSLQKALRAIAGVCGWVILFRVILGFASRWFLWFLPDGLQVFLCGLLELTNGCCRLSEIPDEAVRFVCCAVMLNFGGICVLMQTMDAVGELGILPYLKGKIIQAMIAFLLSLPFSGILPPWSLGIMAIAIIFAVKRRKICRFPAALGV